MIINCNLHLSTIFREIEILSRNDWKQKQTQEIGIKFKRPEVKPLAIEYVKYFFSKHVRKNI